MTNNVQEREVLLQRELPFARELVWKVMTEVEHTNQWWGPDGFQNVRVNMDFRVGGSWTYDMVAPDGTVFPNRVLYKEIVAPSRIVADHGDHERVWFESTITLQETAAGTLVTLRHLFPTRQERDDVVEKYGAIEGGKQHLAKLDAYLRGLD